MNDYSLYDSIAIDEEGLLERLGKEVLYADLRGTGLYVLGHDETRKRFYIEDDDVGIRIYLTDGMTFSIMESEYDSPRTLLNTYTVHLKGRNAPD